MVKSFKKREKQIWQDQLSYKINQANCWKIRYNVQSSVEQRPALVHVDQVWRVNLYQLTDWHVLIKFPQTDKKKKPTNKVALSVAKNKARKESRF